MLEGSTLGVHAWNEGVSRDGLEAWDHDWEAMDGLEVGLGDDGSVN
jgi:hypothetical protein